VALVGRSGEILLISLVTLEVTGRMPSPGHEITSLAADSEGEWLVAGASDGALEALNLEQGTVAITQGPLHPAPSTCALSADGAAVACASSAAVVVRTVERSGGVMRPETRVAAAGQPGLLALGPAGSPVFTVTDGTFARDGQAAPGWLESTRFIAASDSRVAMAGRSADGRPSLAVGPPGLESPRPPSTFSAPVTALALMANGSRLLVATEDGKVRTLQPSPGAMSEVSSVDVPGRGAVSALTGSDDGKRIAIGTNTGDVYLAVEGGGAPRKIAELHAPVGCLGVARAGRGVIASADRRVSVIDADTTLSFVVWTTSSTVTHCARSPAEDRFSFVDADGTTWLKALDLAGVTESYVPADPAVVPTPEGWKGLPVGLVR
jgi:WD40 repeat protein